MRATALALFLLLASFASADVTTSALTGRVLVAGAPAAGVTVTAASPALQHERTTITGPRGTYWLEALPPGEYEVTFALAGHTTLTRSAIVELARVSRADATLEVNEDEDSVTSTATSIDVAATTAITTHFDDRFLDNLPLGRELSGLLVPDPAYSGWQEVDDVPYFFSQGEDLIEEVTVIRGGTAPDYELYSGAVMQTRTRHGREDVFASLRGTPWSDISSSNSLEGTAGGHIVPQRLWFFAAGWGNGSNRGANAKLQAQLGASHNLEANVTESRYHLGSDRAENDRMSLRHTMVAGPHFSAETEIATMSFGNRPRVGRRTHYESDYVTSRASYLIPTRSGDHVLTASFRDWEGDTGYSTAYSVGDRWSTTRWVVNAGVQYADDIYESELRPRIAVNFDPRGDGRQAWAASYGDHGFGTIAALGYAMAVGNSGSARVDVLRRDEGFGHFTHSLQLDGRYRLFNRFEAGATGSVTRGEFTTGGTANVWLGASLPVGGHELGVMLFERTSNDYDRVPDEWHAQTDVALRYVMNFSRVVATIAADGADVFKQGFPRRNRVWIRLLFK
jgi:hypothetical protein